MTQKNCRLYVGNKNSSYSSFEEAKDAAIPHMANKVELRIEVQGSIEQDEADWWAYDYEDKLWAPS